MGGTQTVATSTISGYVYEAMTGPGASTSIDVIAPPSIATSFNPGTIDQGGTAAHVITITNPSANPRPLTGVHFTESLPAGLTVASAAGSMCGGTLTLTAPNSIALSDVSIPTGGTRCQFSFTVTGSHPGTLTATTSHVGSGNGGTGNAASARLVVRAPATPTPAPTPPPAEPATPPPAEVTPAPAEVTPAPVATESVEVPPHPLAPPRPARLPCSASRRHRLAAAIRQGCWLWAAFSLVSSEAA